MSLQRRSLPLLARLSAVGCPAIKVVRVWHHIKELHAGRDNGPLHAFEGLLTLYTSLFPNNKRYNWRDSLFPEVLWPINTKLHLITC